MAEAIALYICTLLEKRHDTPEPGLLRPLPTRPLSFATVGTLYSPCAARHTLACSRAYALGLRRDSSLLGGAWYAFAPAFDVIMSWLASHMGYTHELDT